MALNVAMVPYDLTSALFTDYAFKQRAVYVPAGKKIGYTTTGTLDFPIGSAIIKTFYYPKASGTDSAYVAVAQKEQTLQGISIDLKAYRLIETRVLVHQEDGSWAAISYVWDDDQKDASLSSGKYIDMELVPTSGSNQKFTYVVPNQQSCQQCHASATAGAGSALPIGPKARNMNKNYTFADGTTKNQLVNLNDLNLLSGFTGAGTAPSSADWKDSTQTLMVRAKAYLDVNCAHCHNDKGYALQSGLNLTLENIGSTPNTETWGVCKKPLAFSAPPGAGVKYDIAPGSPDTSVLLYRMSHTNAGIVMPITGRQTNHTEALVMLRSWVTQLAQPNCPP